MFYKKEIDGSWWTAKEVSNAKYELNENNRQSIDGWQYFEQPPKEYLEWSKNQEDLIKNQEL